jgi:hypothetical protein
MELRFNSQTLKYSYAAELAGTLGILCNEFPTAD